MRAITNFFTQLVQRVVPAMTGPQPWQHDAPTPDFKVRWERVASYFMSLPLQTYYDRPALERLTARELKDVAAERGVPIAGLLEKADIVSRLLEGGDTSSGGDECIICSEAYIAGEDVVRVLPCKHSFHVECIDHWFRNPVDYSRRPCCPMCKAELPLPD